MITESWQFLRTIFKCEHVQTWSFLFKLKYLYFPLGVHGYKDKQFQCEICFERFSWKISLDRHLARYHGSLEYKQCKLCSRSFKVESILVEHMRRVHENLKNYSCDRCDKKFFKNGDLKVEGKIISWFNSIFNLEQFSHKYWWDYNGSVFRSSLLG